MFGISTHLYHGQRLDRGHLVEIAAHGFDAVEVFATRTHFDYRDPRAAEALAEWLEDTRLALHALHAPVTASYANGAPGPLFSTAAGDDGRRQRALAEAEAALAVARVAPYRYLVVHLGVPQGPGDDGDNRRDAARRSLERLHELAEGTGVAVALEILPNPLSTADSLVALIEELPEARAFGICLDVGHAFLMGDLVEAIEACSGHLLTTHLHDNGGTRDEHLVPWSGRIDWDAAVLALQKVGYDGAWMFEVAGAADPAAVLARTAEARVRLAALLGLAGEG